MDIHIFVRMYTNGWHQELIMIAHDETSMNDANYLLQLKTYSRFFQSEVSGQGLSILCTPYSTNLHWPDSDTDAIAFDSHRLNFLFQMFAISRRKVDHAWQTTSASTSAQKTTSVGLLSTAVVRAMATTLQHRRNATKAVEATRQRSRVTGCTAQAIVTFQPWPVHVRQWPPDGTMIRRRVTAGRSTTEDVKAMAITSSIMMTVPLSAAKVKKIVA